MQDRDYCTEKAPSGNCASSSGEQSHKWYTAGMRAAYLVQGIGFMAIIVAVVYALNTEPVAAPEIAEDITTNTLSMSSLTLTSSAFAEGGLIPSFYTCDGANSAPPLSVAGVPEGTVSLALIVDDPDIPDSVKESRGIDVFDHWIVFNIPPTTTIIEEDLIPAAIVGVNSGGKNEYTGPCPPDGEHRYFFKLYALDTSLELSEGSTKAEVEALLEGHVLEEATLMGRYERTAE